MRRASVSRFRRRRGFTLMEVMLVLVILVIMGSLAVGIYNNVQKSSYQKTAKIAVTQSIAQAIDLYHVAVGEYPDTLEDLRQGPADPARNQKWIDGGGPFIKASSDLRDPWENPYQYQPQGQRNPDTYDLWSSGPNGQNGDADDIGNWD